MKPVISKCGHCCMDCVCETPEEHAELCICPKPEAPYVGYLQMGPWVR